MPSSLALLLLCSGNIYQPPIYNITASSLFDAGRQHGKLAKDRIRGWFAGDEVQELVAFVKDGAGKKAYTRLRKDSTNAFPLYADELRGIAEGSKLPLDLNLMTNSNSSHVKNTTDHCTDISAISAGGYAKGFAHGHNEDWSAFVGGLYYYVKYTAAEGADFASCAGLAYPGSLIGWAPTWNAHGLFMTVNTLVPDKIKPHGISTSFIQREAICGVGKGRNLKEVIAGLSNPGWSDGASLNLVDTFGRGMANVETYLDTHDTQIVSERLGNNSHFNVYERLPVAEAPGPSSAQRQAVVDALPAPRSRDDVKNILSNTPSIMRDITIATLLLDNTGRLEVWGGSAPATTQPLHSWDLHVFFDTESDEGDEDKGKKKHV